MFCEGYSRIRITNPMIRAVYVPSVVTKRNTPSWNIFVDNVVFMSLLKLVCEINKHSLRSNTKGYGGKTE
jgi:hypothetical protein